MSAYEQERDRIRTLSMSESAAVVESGCELRPVFKIALVGLQRIRCKMRED